MTGIIRISTCGLVLVGIIPLISGCEKPTSVSWDTLDMVVADDSNVPTAFAERYRRDAESLALRYLHESNEGHYEGVEISKFIIDAHYYSLIHVFNAVDISARDSIVIHNIHTNGVPDTRELLVAVSRGSICAETWSVRQQMTGVAIIDSLMSYYDLQPIRYHSWQLLEYDVAVLRPGRPLNIRALALLFENTGYVLYAEPNAVAMSFTNNLSVQLQTDYFLIDYLRWWSDFEDRHWFFKVYKNGDVEFAGSSSGL